MRHQTFSRVVVPGIAGVLVVLASTNAAHAQPTVETGWDLFVTDTAFLNLTPSPAGLQPFESAPLGMFDFGSGPVVTGDTDTIVERLNIATVPGTSFPDTAVPIDIEIVALQLVSVAPFDLDGPGPAPFGLHYATLQIGTPSLGTLDITFDDANSGTFDSAFTVFFDLRFGAPNGPILASDNKTFTATGVPWERGPLANLLVPEIDNVNRFHAGLGDRSQDFWVPGAIHDAGGGTIHVVNSPEPASLALLALGGLVLRRRRRMR